MLDSDNGANPLEGGSNSPLRGEKTTVWEGGTRVPAVIRAPGLQPGLSQQLFHITDWLPRSEALILTQDN